MGDLERALGNGEAARQFFEKALAIAERLVAQEPNRADYWMDVVNSLVQFGTTSHFQRALEIVIDLKQRNRLAKADEWKIGDLRERLQKEKGAGA